METTCCHCFVFYFGEQWLYKSFVFTPNFYTYVEHKCSIVLSHLQHHVAILSQVIEILKCYWGKLNPCSDMSCKQDFCTTHMLALSGVWCSGCYLRNFVSFMVISSVYSLWLFEARSLRGLSNLVFGVFETCHMITSFFWRAAMVASFPFDFLSIHH